MKLVLESGKPLVLEEEMGEGTLYSYVPVVEMSKNEEVVLAVIQYRYSALTENDKLIRQHTESCVRRVGMLVKTNLKWSSAVTAVTLPSRLTELKGLSAEDFIGQRAPHISQTLSEMIHANVCILIPSDDRSSLEDNSSRGKGGDVIYTGTVCRWLSNAAVLDKAAFSTTVSASNFCSGYFVRPSLLGTNNDGCVYVVLRILGEHLLVVESTERFYSEKIRYIESFATLISSLRAQHTLSCEHQFLSRKAILQEGIISILTAENEDALHASLFKHFSDVFEETGHWELIWVDRAAIANIDALRRKKLGFLSSEVDDFSRQTMNNVCAWCLSSGSPITAREGVDGSRVPLAFIPIVLKNENGLALVVRFDSVMSLNRFMVASHDLYTCHGSPNIDDIIRVCKTVSAQYEALHLRQKCNYEHKSISSVMMICKCISKLIEECSGFHEGKHEGNYLATPHGTMSYTEKLAQSIMEFNQKLEPDIVREFKLHWRDSHLNDTSQGDQPQWMSHTRLPSNSKIRSPHPSSPGQSFQNTSFVLNISPASDLLQSLGRNAVEIVSNSSEWSVFFVISESVALEMQLAASIFGDELIDGTPNFKAGDNDADDMNVLIQDAMRFLFTPVQTLIFTIEKLSEDEQMFLKTRSTTDSERAAMDILSDCIFDIYDHSTADLESSRTDACIQAAHFHLCRLPTMSKIDIEYISPNGQVHSIFHQPYLSSPSPMTKTLFKTFSTSKIDAPYDASNTLEVPFECHGIKGKITAVYGIDDLSAGESIVRLVTKIVAKVLSRRIYELDKSYRNKSNQKKQSEELSRRK